MPTFANVNGNSNGDSNGIGNKIRNLEDVFKSSPNQAILDECVKKYRLRAIEILQTILPSKLAHIQTLLLQEEDPESIVHPSRLTEGQYIKTDVFQPGSEEARDAGFLGAGQGVVMPDTIVGFPGLEGKMERLKISGDVGLKGEEEGEETGKTGVRIGPHWFEIVPQNKVQCDLINLCTKEVEELHLLAQDLRIWLETEIPIIEDGNSFGAEVQMSMIRELQEVYKRSNAMQNGCRAHFSDRLRLAQEWVKFPNLMDYPVAIAASDRFDHFLIRSYLRTLVITYAGLLTKFERNWTKIIHPKGAGHHASGGMY